MLTWALAATSGALIGLVLGLIGGGGSILAVPLLIYLVGEPSTHMAIGTAACAVALNAATGLALHARRQAIRWSIALVFSAAGVAGALVGAEAGKAVDGRKLLALFGAVMIVVGVMMLRRRGDRAAPPVPLTRETAPRLLPRLIGLGGAVGLLSGFFGIGGGFLIVPALMWAADMEVEEATSASLVAVAAFGISSASSYAVSGLVDWPHVALLVLGGAAGAFVGARMNATLAEHKGMLTRLFAWFVMAAGLYIVGRGIEAFRAA